jgi:hypothetical protein
MVHRSRKAFLTKACDGDLPKSVDTLEQHFADLTGGQSSDRDFSADLHERIARELEVLADMDGIALHRSEQRLHPPR